MPVESNLRRCLPYCHWISAGRRSMLETFLPRFAFAVLTSGARWPTLFWVFPAKPQDQSWLHA